MEYTVKALADLSGTTPRALRWYDRLGLLRPAQTTPAGYRLYGPAEVERLQQILFYRELGLSLEEIRTILDDPAFDRQAALQGHLTELQRRRARIDGLIRAVELALLDGKGEIEMTDEEKFQAFRRQVEENEARYGQEVRAKYGDAAAEESARALRGMSPADAAAWTALDQEIRTALAQAVEAGEDPAGAKGREIAALHEKWLRFTDKSYSRAKHRGIAELYVQDERFTAYYDGQVPGCARFLRDAVAAYTGS